jgi:aflatoxin B1 aldehyde reductase
LIGQLLHGLYDRPSYHRYLEEYIKLAKESGIAQSEIAYRWVVYHSVLRKENDTVIVGAQTAKQLEETMVGIERGPLEEWVVGRLEEMWKIVEGDAPRDNFEVFNELREEGVEVIKDGGLT